MERPQQAYGAKRAVRALAGLSALAAILLLGTLTGGCAVSGMFGIAKDDAMAKAETTGSIPPTAGRLSSGLPPEADLVLARAAIAEVLSTRRKDFSTSWENPSTGARGTVTPIAAAYEQDGVTCHDFLASHLQRPRRDLDAGRGLPAAPGPLGGQGAPPLEAFLIVPAQPQPRCGSAANSHHIRRRLRIRRAAADARPTFIGVALMRDPYGVLGVPKNASEAAIKSAYRKLAKKLHPDANKHDKNAASKFAELNAAYEIVGDEDKRKAFDRGEIDGEGKPRFRGFEGFGAGRASGRRRVRPRRQFRNLHLGAGRCPTRPRWPRRQLLGGIDDILKGMFGSGGRRTAVRAGRVRRRADRP